MDPLTHRAGRVVQGLSRHGRQVAAPSGARCAAPHFVASGGATRLRFWRGFLRRLCTSVGVSFRAAKTARNPLRLARVARVGWGFLAVSAARNDTAARSLLRLLPPFV